MKLLLKNVFLIMSLMLLYSCASESNIFDGYYFPLTKVDKSFVFDSFQVTRVVDNRIPPDSIIGFVDDKETPLIINRLLNAYLKMAFNKLLCNDTVKITRTPLTIYIDTFFSGRGEGSMNYCRYHKYSYLFEYNYGNRTNKLRVIDSIANCDGRENSDQTSQIRYGIRRATRLFLANHFNNYPLDSSGKLIETPREGRSDADTIDLNKILRFIPSHGGMINLIRGQNIRFGIQLTYADLYSNSLFRYEYCYGWALQYSNVLIKREYDGTYKRNQNGHIIEMSLPYFHRFNFSNNKDGLFLDLGMSIGLQTELTRASSPHFYFGGSLSEKIGYHISNSSIISIGAYQQKHINAKLLPYDYGFMMSFHFINLNQIL